MPNSTPSMPDIIAIALVTAIVALVGFTLRAPVKRQRGRVRRPAPALQWTASHRTGSQRGATPEPAAAPAAVAGPEPVSYRVTSRQHRSGQRMYVPPATTAAVIPAHNEAVVIEETLRSVLANFLPEDVYVFCDGCTDETATIARRYLPTANVIESDENVGKSRGMEYVLKAFILPREYVYVTMIDADTTLDTDFLYQSLKVLRRKSVACVVGQVKSRWYPRSIISVYRTYVYFMVFALLKRMQSLTNSISIASGCATTWKTRVLNQIDFDHRLSTEDIDLTIQVHRHGLGTVKYASSAVVWTQDPFTMQSFQRQTSRWNRAWWEVVRKHRLGMKPVSFRRDRGIGISVLDIATMLLMFDIIVLGIPSLILFPIFLLYPVDFHLSVPLLQWGIDFSTRAAILTLLAWQYAWLLGTALIVALIERRPRVFFFSPLFMVLTYIEVALYISTCISTMKSLYIRPISTTADATSGWLSPERR